MKLVRRPADVWHARLQTAGLSWILAFALAIALVWSGPGQAQSWTQDDPSAIVLPGQPGNATGGGGGGLFRLFRFEPQRQRQQPVVQAVPQVDVAPLLNLPPPKDPDAITVVMLGDEFADQMREGMIDRFDGDSMIEADGVSIPGSGLTQIAEFNWNIEALRRLEDFTQIGAIVVAIGYSDRQPLLEGERSYSFGSATWRDLYRDRVTSFALTLVSQGHPVIFAGLPVMQDPALNEDIRLLNQIIAEAVAPTRARFVSVYEAFSDLSGNYARSGPNMAGVVEDLRTSDGIFFNRAGREKFAHFIERYIPRDGQGAPEPEVSSVIFEGSTLSGDGIGPVIMLTSGFADPTAVLATDASAMQPEEDDARQRLLRGASIPVPAGRADSFAWPGGSDG